VCARNKKNDLRCRVLCRTPGSFDRWPLARRSACPNTRVFGRSPSQNALSPAPGERVLPQTLTHIQRLKQCNWLQNAGGFRHQSTRSSILSPRDALIDYDTSLGFVETAKHDYRYLSPVPIKNQYLTPMRTP